MKYILPLLLLLLSLFLTLTVGAQLPLPPSSDSASHTSDASPVDSSYTEAEKSNNLFKILFRGKPGRALMWSALPGGGQLYNRRYWKVPLVYAGLGATAYIIIQRRQVYTIYDEAFRMRVDLGDQSTDRFQGVYNVEVLQNFRREADKALFESYVWFGLVYLISGIEAYVDRHLMEFDISDDLSFALSPYGVHPAVSSSLSPPVLPLSAGFFYSL